MRCPVCGPRTAKPKARRLFGVPVPQWSTPEPFLSEAEPERRVGMVESARDMFVARKNSNDAANSMRAKYGIGSDEAYSLVEAALNEDRP